MVDDRGGTKPVIGPARKSKAGGWLRGLARTATGSLRPNETMKATREGFIYFLVWLALLFIGLYHQSNLMLLIAGLAAGPLVASMVVSSATLRRLQVTRRSTPFAFAGGDWSVDYILENRRRRTAALAMVVEDEMTPADRGGSGTKGLSPKVDFPRVAARTQGRARWQGKAPERGKYLFRSLELVTRSPFGLMERRETIEAPGELIVYPAVGSLSRRWQQIHRETSETKRGLRHDRSAQQQEYHGLRDYRPGDSPRWIHWRTTAKVGQPMVKEFEQQSEQDLAVLLDPWLPRSKVTPEQREAMEAAIRFASSLCLSWCRKRGPRLLLGWTGAQPGIRQGPASVKLLHEVLGQLAVLRPSSEGQLSALFDAMPASTLRESMLVVVSTRHLDLLEEAERSTRLSSGSGRGLAGRVVVLDALRGDLDGLVHFEGAPNATELGDPAVRRIVGQDRDNLEEERP